MIIQTMGSSYSTGTTETKKTNQLDRDAFLKLLITQLSNQDPLNPMEDQEFISQLAQFSSLEQMQTMSTSMSSITSTLEPFLQNQVGFSAASWVGRTITAKDPNPPKDSNGNLVDPLTDEEGNVVTGTDGKPMARNLETKVQSVFFTEEGPILRAKVTQKFVNINTGQIEEKEVEKNIPLGNVFSVS